MELNNLDADVVSIQWGAGGNQVPTLMAMPQRQGPVEACLKCPGSTEDGANTCAWQGTQKAFEKRRTWTKRSCPGDKYSYQEKDISGWQLMQRHWGMNSWACLGTSLVIWCHQNIGHMGKWLEMWLEGWSLRTMRRLVGRSKEFTLYLVGDRELWWVVSIRVIWSIVFLTKIANFLQL